MKHSIVKTLLLLSLLFVSVGSTIAYLTDVEQEVNVMTLGRVEIDLIEQERNSAGTLVDFQDFHPLYPGYYPKGLDAFDKDGYWLNVQNAVDKVVTVKNTGAAPAYVRLWFAFEVTDDDKFFNKIHLNRNTTDWQWEFMYDKTTGNFDFLTQDGSRYVVATATYNQVLAPNATTPVSLRQVLLESSATNDDFEKLGDKYSIFVVAQGMQTAGFDSAAVALAEGFGVPSVKNHPFAGMKEENTVFCCTQMDLRTVVSPKDDNTHTESQICINCGKIHSVISVTHRYNSSGTCACGATEKPAEPTDTPFKWTNNGTSITITGYTGTDTEVVIPATIEGLPVTTIGAKAFVGHNEWITSIVLPESIKTIEHDAFSGCGLATITIPASVVDIGEKAFLGCNNLIDIVVDSDNTTYASRDGVLYNSNFSVLLAYPGGKHGSYTILDNTASIGNSAFYHCINLTSITIPDSVNSIGYAAFSGCTSLTSITIPDSVTSIGDWAFSGCSSLTNITIPNSVTSIGNWAFSNCSALRNITIPDSVISIGDRAFFGCSSLTSITIPDSVTTIAYGAFESCTSLTSITIPDSVTSISAHAFNGCTSLTSITIPDSVNSIADRAFQDCSVLTNITIPDSVNSIGEGAFFGCSSLTSITIPDSVTSIGNNTFRHCSSLTNITIPNSVTNIGKYAFDGCDKLTVYGSTEYVKNWCAQYGVTYKPLF